MRALLVEDDAKAARLLAKGLREEGWAVDLASTLAEGRERAAMTRYDALILDRMLPDGDGARMCEELRRRGAQVPVLLLTARDAVEDRVGGLNSGADDYLTKPFAFAELLARLQALLRRAELTRLPVLEVGDLSLDPATRTVTRGDEVVPLTRTEFSLLEALMRRAGEVASRSYLAERVWQEDRDGMQNLVDVHVSHLRRKLDGGRTPLIHTVRGLGFRLAASESS